MDVHYHASACLWRQLILLKALVSSLLFINVMYVYVITVQIESIMLNNPVNWWLFISVNITTLPSPQELMVYDGDGITLPCLASLPGPSIRWFYSKSQNTPQDVIFDWNTINSNYTNKVTVSINELTGDCNLTLQNVQLNESGWYICIVDGGSTFLHPIFLTVNG